MVQVPINGALDLSRYCTVLSRTGYYDDGQTRKYSYIFTAFIILPVRKASRLSAAISISLALASFVAHAI